MGLIRKSLAVGSLGLVRPNSKKQRVAKAQLKELKKQTAAIEAEAKTTASDARIADAVARASAESRARSAAARAVAQAGSHDERKVELDRIRAASNGAAMPVPVALPPEGWYPDADRPHLLRWWDGAAWTDRTAPRVS